MYSSIMVHDRFMGGFFVASGRGRRALSVASAKTRNDGLTLWRVRDLDGTTWWTARLVGDAAPRAQAQWSRRKTLVCAHHVDVRLVQRGGLAEPSPWRYY